MDLNLDTPREFHNFANELLDELLGSAVVARERMSQRDMDHRKSSETVSSHPGMFPAMKVLDLLANQLLVWVHALLPFSWAQLTLAR